MKQIKDNLILDIRPQTAKEEYDYLWYTLKQLLFFKENNYTVELPNHPIFLELAEKSPNFGQVDKTSLFNLFKKEVYNPDFFKSGTVTLESYRPIFNEAISKFTEMNKKWGFKIFPKYSVLLTRYGPGGSYNPNKGSVIMMTNINGTFKKFHPEETVIHEIIHIGIEENIVSHFSLDHWEKEAVVDLICILNFKDILPNYQVQSQGNKKINDYITSISINQLPKAVKKYVTDFPRKF